MRYVVKHAGGGLWRVIDEETNLPINDALMSKDEAKATAEAANKAAAPLEEATPEVPATIAPLTFIVIPAGNSLYSVICETTGDFISTAPMPTRSPMRQAFPNGRVIHESSWKLPFSSSA